MKVDGITLLAMARDKKLKSHTILRTIHEPEYFDDYKLYDYYIYFEDNQFHRCDANGKLGAKFQNRFLNYEVLRKEFEIVEEIEKTKEIEKVIIEYDNKDEQCKLAYANSCYELSPQEVIILDKIEELRKTVNYLLKKEDEKQ